MNNVEKWKKLEGYIDGNITALSRFSGSESEIKAVKANLIDIKEYMKTLENEISEHIEKENIENEVDCYHNGIAHHNSSSWYKGVTKRSDNTFEAAIRIDGENVYLGKYTTQDEAGRAYNNAVDEKLGGNGQKNIIGQDNRKKSSMRYAVIPKDKIPFKGVYSHHEKFMAKIQYNKKTLTIGVYDSIEKAALARDITEIYLFENVSDLNQDSINMTDELKEFQTSFIIPRKIYLEKNGK